MVPKRDSTFNQETVAFSMQINIFEETSIPIIILFQKIYLSNAGMLDSISSDVLVVL